MRGSAARANGRGDWIRTSDLFVPNEARYQTAPRPDGRQYGVSKPERNLPGDRDLKNFGKLCGFVEFLHMSCANRTKKNGESSR